MRLICCSHWPPRPCFITQSFFPHFLFTLPYPTNCAYINTFIPIRCLQMAMNVKGRNFFHSQELNKIMLFEVRVLTAFHFDCHWTGVMNSCGFRVTHVGGERSREFVELVLSQLHYSNKEYDRGGNTFQPVLVYHTTSVSSLFNCHNL